MGLDNAEVGTDERPSASSWGWRLHLHSGRSGAGAVALAAGSSAVASADRGRVVRPPSVESAIVRLRVSWLQVLTAGAAAILALEFLRPVAHSFPTLRAAVETLMTLLALSGAVLVSAQFAHTRRLRELLLLGALLTLALTDFFANALPAALHVHSVSGFTAAQPWGQLTVAAALAAAALTPSNKLITGGRRPQVITAALSVVAFAVAELGGLLLRSQLLAGATYSGLGIDRALRHPLGLVVLIGTVGLFAYAAHGFARRAKVERNSVLSLLGGAAILFAVARLYYLALPSVSPEAITPREALRVLAFVLVLAMALRQDAEMRATATRAAAIAERRRVAEDLHDGLAQDLAFIASYGVRMAQELGSEHPVTVAATRALAVSRETISGLSDMSATPPAEALEAIAHELRDRFEIAIAVDAQPDAELASVARDHVARIAREAIANAARHGGARNVEVSLKRTNIGVALRVCDDGCGIRGPAGSPPQDGFGLGSMRDRAAALGGSLTIRQRKAGGTELEVVLP